MIKINLANSESKIYKENSLELSSRVNLIYGKNGTGKSTLCNLIKEQLSEEYDVKIFNGFDSVLSENDRLDLVTLGEENVQIERTIKELEVKLKNKQEEFNKNEVNLIDDDNNKDNLFAKYSVAQSNLKNANKNLEAYLSKRAKSIKDSDLRISISTYNKSDLIEDLKRDGAILSSEEQERCRNTIRSVVKKATKIERLPINIGELAEEVEVILHRTVTPITEILELKNNKELTNFAKEGLRLHKVGDRCAFCGSVISNERYETVKNYFEEDKAKQLESELIQLKAKVKSLNSLISNLKFDAQEFYSEYSSEVSNINTKFQDEKKSVINFLQNLLDILNHKSIFAASNEHVEVIQSELNDLIRKYNNLVEQNNSSKLEDLKQKAKDKLLLHEIKSIKTNAEYLKLLNIKQKSEIECLSKNAQFNQAKQQSDLLQKEVEEIQKKIRDEKLKKTSVRKLAENINKKLRTSVNFTLEPYEDESSSPENVVGYYKIKNSNTEEFRSVTELSTGEKNIVAFLYFIERLNSDNPSIDKNKNRIIVFDDPMTSNDDFVQYIIINELNKLIQVCNKKNNSQNTLVMLTHNTHFYLNQKFEIERFNRDAKDKTDLDFLFHMLSDKVQTVFYKIEDQSKDYKTSYEQLWEELAYLAKNISDENSHLLLNPIRRIIETFTKFNGINTYDFYHKVGIDEFYKLNNVNSHSIDDLEADLSGKSKKEILAMFKNSFELNNSIAHYETLAKKFGLNKLSK